MYHKLFDQPLTPHFTRELPDGVLSPADVMEIMFRKFDVPSGKKEEAVTNELRRKASETLDERQKKNTAVQDHLATIAQVMAYEKEKEKKRRKKEDTDTVKKRTTNEPLAANF